MVIGRFQEINAYIIKKLYSLNFTLLELGAKTRQIGKVIFIRIIRTKILNLIMEQKLPVFILIQFAEIR